MRHVYTSIDIGTSSIKIAVAELYKGRLNLLAVSSVESKGVKKGLIMNADDASSSVKKAIDEIEAMLGIKITKIIANIPSYFAEYHIVKGEISIDSEDKVINGEDVTKLLQVAMKSKIVPDSEMITIIPIDFKVDNGEPINEPKGLIGNTFSMRAIMVTTGKKNVYSVVSLLENMGLEVIDISISSIGDAYAHRNSSFENGVSALINIGCETTTVSLYNKGIIVKSSVIGLGGRNIDNDLSYMYKLDIDTASKIKEKFALAHKKYATVSDLYEVMTKDGSSLKVNQFEVSEIVMSRLEEILTLAKKEINVLTNKEINYIIVTGGTSNMSQLDIIINEIFGKMVIIGKMPMIGVRNNKYSSVIGNIVYFINKLRLQGKDYTMISNDDMIILSSPKKNVINVSNESMLGKVFGYFFGE